MLKTLFYKTLRQVITLSLVGLAIFILAEPTLGLSQTTQSTFTISQTVGKEISFTTTASNITMSPASLGGLTGGTSFGSTTVVILTNDHLGYHMTIAASSSLGMIGNASSSNYIPAYVPSVAGVPDYTFTTPANRAYFGYTVLGSTTADVDQHFRSNGSNACATGSTNDGAHCWLNASTTNMYITNSNYYTPASGATTTLVFRVTISANPAPTIPDDTYVATTTLTATAN